MVYILQHTTSKGKYIVLDPSEILEMTASTMDADFANYKALISTINVSIQEENLELLKNNPLKLSTDFTQEWNEWEMFNITAFEDIILDEFEDYDAAHFLYKRARRGNKMEQLLERAVSEGEKERVDMFVKMLLEEDPQNAFAHEVMVKREKEKAEIKRKEKESMQLMYHSATYWRGLANIPSILTENEEETAAMDNEMIEYMLAYLQKNPDVSPQEKILEYLKERALRNFKLGGKYLFEAKRLFILCLNYTISNR